MNESANQDASNQVRNLWPIPGFHGAREALKRDEGGIRISALWVAQGKKSGRIEEITALAKARGIPVTFKPPRELDRLAPHVAHQGIVALAAPFAYRPLEEIADHAFQANGPALLVALDHITDEGNLSSLIRSSAFFGVHGIILPKDRSAQITPTVLKRSSGACVHVPITRVVNMARALTLLNQQGFWIIGTSPPALPDQ
ncbi:MAG: TrmH family RNA methyltransferase, partial [Desulfobacteraceae bacterium]